MGAPFTPKKRGFFSFGRSERPSGVTTPKPTKGPNGSGGIRPQSPQTPSSTPEPRSRSSSTSSTGGRNTGSSSGGRAKKPPSKQDPRARKPEDGSLRKLYYV